MTTASLATRGYGTGGSIAGIIRRDYSIKPVPHASLATRGYGAGSSVAGIVRRGYSPYPIVIPPGDQAIVVAGLPWIGDSVLFGASPAVQDGDIIIYDPISSPGNYAITMNADGTFTIATNTDTSRQSFVSNVYSFSLAAYYGDFTTWVNNKKPQQTAGIRIPSLPRDQPITPIDLSNVVIDAEGDALTYSVSPLSVPLPQGLLLVGSVVSGSPAFVGTTSVTFRVTDITGDYTDLSPAAFAVTGVTPPPPPLEVKAITVGTYLGVPYQPGDIFTLD